MDTSHFDFNHGSFSNGGRVEGQEDAFSPTHYEARQGRPGASGTDFQAMVYGGMGAGSSPMPDQKDYKTFEDWAKAYVIYICLKAQEKATAMLTRITISTDMERQVQSGSFGGKIPFVSPLFAIHNQMRGEKAAEVYRINSYVSNADAITRKNEMRGHFLSQYTMQEEGLPIPDNVPQILMPPVEQIEATGSPTDFFEKSYRDKYAEAAEKLWKDWEKRSLPLTWEQWRQMTYSLYVITGCAYHDPYIDPITLEVMNPLIHPNSYIPDVDCTDDYFSEKQYKIRFRFQNIDTLQLQYPQLEREKLLKLLSRPNTFFGLPVIKEVSAGKYETLVVEASFIAPAKTKTEIAVPTDDSLYMGDGELAFESKTFEHAYQEVYEVVLVGGTQVIRAEKCKYQIRSSDAPWKACMSSSELVYGYHAHPDNPSSGSHRLAWYIEMRNMIYFKIFERIGQLAGPVLRLNLKRIPFLADGTASGIEQFLSMLRKNRLIIEDDTSENGIQMDTPAATTVDLDGDMNSVQSMISAVQMLDQQIENIMGFNPSRSGQINKYEASTNATLNLAASNNATADRNQAYNSFEDMAATKTMNLLKLSYFLKRQRMQESMGGNMQKEVLSTRFGDIDEFIDNKLLYQDLGITFQRRNNTEDLKQVTQRAVDMSMQGVPLENIAIMLEVSQLDDPTTAPAIIMNRLREIEQRKQKENERQMMMQQQIQKQNLRTQGQIQSQLTEQANRGRLENTVLAKSLEDTENAFQSAQSRVANQLEPVLSENTE